MAALSGHSAYSIGPFAPPACDGPPTACSGALTQLLPSGPDVAIEETNHLGSAQTALRLPGRCPHAIGVHNTDYYPDRSSPGPLGSNRDTTLRRPRQELLGTEAPPPAVRVMPTARPVISRDYTALVSVEMVNRRDGTAPCRR
jgi:hypothetical protein